ncbi:MAG: Gfo/Idh/MocA family oxidoreductase [Anaerolineae bacterium]
MSDQLRMAVVGVGRIGRVHAENLAHRVRGARLVAVTTSNPARAQEARRRCGHIAVFPTVTALLENVDLDAVVVASSTSVHVDNIKTCAAAGLHVFCEKPLALSLAACDEAIAAVEGAGVSLMLGHVRQFDSGYLAAKARIDAGDIGRPLVFRAIAGDQDPPPPSFADPNVSGGLITDAGYHDLYLARWLVGDEVVRAYAEGEALVDPALGAVGDVDNAIVDFRFAGGGLGTLFVSRTTRYGHDVRVEIIGEEGAVHVGYLRQTPLNLLTRQGVRHDVIPDTAARYSDAFVAELQAFVDSVRRGEPPPVSGQDGKAALAIGLAATQALRQHRPVSLAEIGG